MEYAKVKIGKAKPFYLEHVKRIKKSGMEFVSGYLVHKNGEPITHRGAVVMHLIQVGEGVKIVPQTMNKFYCELENE
jgi:methionine aminopeptidase